MPKKCSRCRETKIIQEFPRKGYRQDGQIKYSSTCKICQRIYGKNHYSRNRKKYIINARKNSINTRNKNRIALQQFKYENGCKECGERDPRCLDFHHISDKKYCVSSLINHSRKVLLQEISKCEVLCANCHRKLHVKLMIDITHANVVELVDTGDLKSPG